MSTGKTFKKAIAINAPISKAWQALTNPELMKSWLFETEIDVISDWQVGSAIVFIGNINGKPFKNTGTILKLETEKVFQYDFRSDLSNLPDMPDALVEFDLVSEGHATQLVLTCSAIANEVIYGHLNFYWATTLDILKKFVERKFTGK